MKKSTKQWLWIGGISAAIAGYYYHYHKKNEPNRILKRIKSELSILGQVKSSWLDDTRHTYHDKGKVYQGYHGGISILHDGKEHYYEFIVKAKNGELMLLNEKDFPI